MTAAEVYSTIINYQSTSDCTLHDQFRLTNSSIEPRQSKKKIKIKQLIYLWNEIRSKIVYELLLSAYAGAYLVNDFDKRLFLVDSKL